MMATSPLRPRTSFVVLGVALVFSLPACASVNQEDLDARLDDLRGEMQQGDQANRQQIDQLSQRVGTVESRIDALERDLRSLNTEFGSAMERLETALRFAVPVHFGYDEAEIREQDQELLDRFASVIGSYYGDATITVEGFTDPAGTEEYNLQLGQRRADAVRQYLIETGGLNAENLRAVSYGEDTSRLVRPDGQGPGDTGMENRRVALVVDLSPPFGS